jgi:hypothetical protein
MPGFTAPPPLTFNPAPKNTAKRKKRDQPTDVMENLPRLGLHPVTPGACTIPLCGDVADDIPEADIPHGWVRTGVYGSTDPDRIWCSGLCATYGIALAEVRATPAPQQEAAGA